MSGPSISVKHNLILEACVDTYGQAYRAVQAGANRIELCSRLDQDGLTPDFRLAELVKANLQVPIRPMIRNENSFNLTDLDEIVSQISTFKNIGVEGFVFGFLDENNEPLYDVIEYLSKHCAPHKVVFHKAIDATDDPIGVLKRLMEVGIDAVLTSGGAPTAEKGVKVLAQMQDLCKNKVELVVAGKVSPGNIELLHQQIGSQFYHGRRIVGDIA